MRWPGRMAQVGGNGKLSCGGSAFQSHMCRMAEQIIYQPYLAGPRGSLRPGTPVVCRTADEGLRRAERAFAGGSILGAQVVRMVHDTASDELGEPEHLGQVGRVPATD